MSKTIPSEYTAQNVSNISPNRFIEADDFDSKARSQNLLFTRTGHRIAGYNWWPDPLTSSRDQRSELELNHIFRFQRYIASEGGAIQVKVFGDRFSLVVRVFNLDDGGPFGDQIDRFGISRDQGSNGWAEGKIFIPWSDSRFGSSATPLRIELDLSVVIGQNDFELYQLHLLEGIVTQTNRLIGKRGALSTKSTVYGTEPNGAIETQSAEWFYQSYIEPSLDIFGSEPAGAIETQSAVWFYQSYIEPDLAIFATEPSGAIDNQSKTWTIN